ncbi:MAG: hypothetical protein AAGA30_10075 [Planctomycetota bacterium]
MNPRLQISLVVLVFAHCLFEVECGITWAQGSKNSSRLGNVSDSFYERLGVGFGFGLPSMNGRNKNNSSVIPIFGGFDPGSSARYGFARRGSGPGFSLGFNFAQGSSRQITNVVPSIVVPNGGVGWFNAGVLRPFITGVAPVVGFNNGATRAVSSGHLRPFDPTVIDNQQNSDTELKVDSSANTSMMGVSEIKELKTKQRIKQRERYLAAIQAILQAEEVGEVRRARVLVRKAINLTPNSDEKAYLEQKIKRLYAK